MSNELTAVEFAGSTLDCIQDGKDVWVSLRRACENIGIDYASQFTKLREKSWATIVLFPTVGLDGKNRDMTMIHLDSLPMWLATIEASRVAPEVRPRLEKYQLECAKVLRDHFFGQVQPKEEDDLLSSLSVMRSLIDAQIQSRQQMLVLERKSLEHEKSLDDIKNQIEEVKNTPRQVPTIQARQRVSQLTRAAGYHKYGSNYERAWGELYREFLYRYRIDLRARGKNDGVAPIEWAQRNGQLDNLLFLAEDLFGDFAS